MKLMHHAAAGVLFALAAATSAKADTIVVAKDGSGDFLVLQDGIESAAPGDTVLVRPGRYDDTLTFSLPGWTDTVHAGVEVDDLTIRGEDRDSVIIGPTVPNFTGFGPKGIVTQVGISSLRVENLTIENVREALYIAEYTTVEGCTLRDCYIGLIGFSSSSLLLRDSVIRNCVVGATTGPPSRDPTFNGVTFRENDTAMEIINTPGALVLDSHFRACGMGIIIQQGSAGTMMRCTFDSLLTNNLIAIDAQIDVQDSDFGGVGENSVLLAAAATLTGVRNRFHPSPTLFLFSTAGAASLSDSELLFGSGFAARLRDGEYTSDPPVLIDFRGNYWGAGVDSTQIAAAILDGNDNPETKAFVHFVPFSTTPIPTQAIGFSDLKARFGN